MFKDRVLRETFGNKLEEEAGGWRKMHNEGFHGILWSPNIMRVINLGSYNLGMLQNWKKRNACKILMGEG